MKHARSGLLILTLAGLCAVGGCNDDDEAPPAGNAGRQSVEHTGATCDVPDDCYPDVADKTTIKGTVECMARVRDGYCTHTCTAITDCCTATGECKTDLVQVCSPFESEPTQKCFVSCEDADMPAGEDPEVFCQREASPDFSCRSSGGGSANRKICMPVDCSVGATCDANLPCAGGTDCLDGFAGGYCGRADCTNDAGCPPNSRCIQHPNGTNYCFATCVAGTDCSLCRGTTYAADCRSDVTFVDTTTPPGSVCVPR